MRACIYFLQLDDCALDLVFLFFLCIEKIGILNSMTWFCHEITKEKIVSIIYPTLVHMQQIM